jgi:predicted nucleic acid-binding protein
MSSAGFVLDTSVALGALFEDEQDDYSLAVLRTLADTTAFVPALWQLEMGNILGRALREGRISAEALAESWSRLSLLDIRVRATDEDARHWAERSVEWGLTSYDCCYLELARQQRMPLATKDAQLAAAARRFGVGVYLG